MIKTAGIWYVNLQNKFSSLDPVRLSKSEDLPTG